MRLVREIEFRVKTENEAFQRVREKLGSDGIILSVQSVRAPSILPFLKKKELVVRAGILEEEKKPSLSAERDPDLQRRQMEVFNALLEYKKDLYRNGEKRDIQKQLAGKVEDKVEISTIDGVTKETLDGLESISPPMEQLLASRMSADLAKALSDEFASSAAKAMPFEEWLKNRCCKFCFPSGPDMLSGALGGNRIMVIGPTGVGKTTTIAKIAAIAVQEGRSIALFTSDNYRVSAVDQIRTFARVLHIPIEAVNNGDEIPELLGKYSEDTIVIMDTPGYGFRERDRLRQIENIYESFRPQVVHMAVSAASRPDDAEAAIKRTGRTVPISRLLLTKADETLGPGCLLSMPMAFGLPLSFITTGQNVPRDINYATPAFITNCILGRGQGLYEAR